MRESRSQRGFLAALAAVFIWALIPVGTRFFVQRVDPLMFNAIRFSASGAAALPLFWRGRFWRWPRADRRLLLWCALLSVPGYNMPVAVGAMTVPAGQLGLLIATEPVLIIALSLLLQHRSLHRRLVIGSTLALAGVVLTSQVPQAHAEFSLAGNLEVLAGAFSWSVYTVLAGRLNRRQGSPAVTGAIVVMGSLMLLAISSPRLVVAPLPGAGTIAALAAMGIASSLLGFILWNHAAATVSAERMGLALYLIPMVAVLAGAALLGETLTAQIAFGGSLTLLGVWIASRTARDDGLETAET